MRFLSRLAAIGLALCVGACAPKSPESHYDAVSFYVCAHEDDCVLFMNPALAGDIAKPAQKVVTVYITAGDAGYGIKPIGDSENAYYIARENAAVEAAKWMADSEKKPLAAPDAEKVIRDGNSLTLYSYKNTRTYFLRLPDGMGTGEGAPGTRHQSLKKLAEGEIDRLVAVDGSADYDGWGELVGTLQAIIKEEAKGISKVSVNLQDPDTAVNKDDHSDHTYSGLATLRAAEPFSCITLHKYEDYITRLKPRNIDDRHLFSTIGAFAVMTSSLDDDGYEDTWDDTHRSSLGRNYFSTIPSNGTCKF